MTVARIKLSQAMIDIGRDAQADAAAFNSDLGSVIDLFALTSGVIGQEYPYYSSYSLNGSTLRVNYPDGASRTYHNFQLANPNAASGVATSTSNEFVAPGFLTFGVAGQMHYDYTNGANGLAFAPSAQGATLNAIRIATHVPSSSPDYDPTVGNVAFVLNGAMRLSSTAQLQGTIDRLSATTDRYIQSSVIEGRFDVSADLVTIGMGLTNSTVDGTVTAYRTTFHDGSYFNVTDTQSPLRANESLEQSLLHASAGNDDIDISLPARLYEDMVVDAGAGNDVLVLAGGGGRLHAHGGSGNDVISLLDDSHRVDGGEGLDAVKFAFARGAATVAAGTAPNTFSVTDATGAVNQLVNVERLVFSDATVALDIEGNAGQAYRLYQAAFNRTPDSGGLGFWIAAMDGGMRVDEVAANFMNTPEFLGAYGSTLSNEALVTRFYENILHRQPEAGGLGFWTGVLDRGASTRAEVLAAISESGENKVALIGVIGDGFTFTPVGG